MEAMQGKLCGCGKIHDHSIRLEIGVDEALLPMIFGATKDIRDKYVLSRLAWDLGMDLV